VSRLNIGNFDRMLRILFGLMLIGLAAAGSIGAWGHAGAALLVSGAAAFCPVYRLLGISTPSR